MGSFIFDKNSEKLPVFGKKFLTSDEICCIILRKIRDIYAIVWVANFKFIKRMERQMEKKITLNDLWKYLDVKYDMYRRECDQNGGYEDSLYARELWGQVAMLVQLLQDVFGEVPTGITRRVKE